MRSKSSARWLQRQHNDPFTEEAKRLGYRSRAAFKLIELQKRDKIFRPGQRVLELGAAPGGWSQLIANWVGSPGQVIALDLLAMAPIKGVDILTGDFTEDATLASLKEISANRAIDVILSDMAPNFSGIRTVDHDRAMVLAELAFECAQELLKTRGTFVVKVFQGEGFDTFLKSLRRSFGCVTSRKPKASRPESQELYLVAKNFCP